MTPQKETKKTIQKIKKIVKNCLNQKKKEK